MCPESNKCCKCQRWLGDSFDNGHTSSLDGRMDGGTEPDNEDGATMTVKMHPARQTNNLMRKRNCG